ncbi:hypothetical protein [Mesorhizobium sp. STM 4661]|uniref:hypothetical protein n=1 Tax=Mesorhizobium sp. STM 4661 TaxID=1297570 RepID=UPI00056678A7|nr:hypothetical protein [Mesorhizobium sp. STM 4661]
MTGELLERPNTVAWEMFRKRPAKALNCPDRSQGGRHLYDAVMMLKKSWCYRLYGLSDEQAEFRSWTGAPSGGSLVVWMPATGSTRVAGQHQYRRRRQPMPKNIEQGNRTCFRTRARVEHPSPNRRTAWDCSSAPSAGRGRGKVKIGVGNFAYNLKRLSGGRVV